MDANTVEEMPRFSEYALKVTRFRESENKFRNKVRVITALTGLGLGLMSSPLALAAATTFSLNEFYRIISGESDLLKLHAIKHKLRKVAYRVNKMYGTKLAFKCDYNNRTAGFVLCDESGKIPVTNYLTSENIQDYLSPEVCDFFMDTLDWELHKMNSYRGKGEDAKTMREIKYKNVPKIGIDNISRAFDDVGGVLSDKELLRLSMGSSLSNVEYKKFMNEHRKEELWTFSSNLSEYLRDMPGMDINDKNKLLMEFRYHFEKYGDEGMQQFNRLCGQLEEEQRINKTL